MKDDRFDRAHLRKRNEIPEGGFVIFAAAAVVVTLAAWVFWRMM